MFCPASSRPNHVSRTVRDNQVNRQQTGRIIIRPRVNEAERWSLDGHILFWILF